MSGIRGPSVRWSQSGELAITLAGTDHTFAHGLGVIPDLTQCRLVCKSSEHGYVQDQDELVLGSTGDAGTGGIALWCNATNVIVRTGTTLSVRTASGTGLVALTAGSWRFKLLAAVFAHGRT